MKRKVWKLSLQVLVECETQQEADAHLVEAVDAMKSEGFGELESSAEFWGTVVKKGY